jgi:hypothetical protein
MRSALSEANKLLLLERTVPAYIPLASIPQEYRSLIIPAAGSYLRQDDDCDILSQHVKLGPFSLWFHDIFARKDIVLSPFVPHHIYSLHSLYEDSLQLKSPHRPPFMLVEKETNLFNLHTGMHQVPMLAGQKVLSVNINISPDDLKQLAKRYPPLKQFAEKQASNISRTLNEYPMYNNAACDLLMQKMLTCRYDSLTAQPFLFRCCLNMFINAANQDAAVQPLQVSSLLQSETIHKIFAYLLRWPNKSYSISELSYMFDISATDLEQGFKQHFAMDVNDCMHMTKMMMVYDLIVNAEFSLREITVASGHDTVGEMVRQMEDYYQCDMRTLM